MTLLKRELASGTDGSWWLFYDSESHELYVTCKTEDGHEKLHRMDSVLKMEGKASDALHLAMFDLFGQGDDATTEPYGRSRPIR